MMKGAGTKVAGIVLTGLCLCTMLGWLAAELLRNPVADLDALPIDGEGSGKTVQAISAPETSRRDQHAGYVGSQVCADCHSAIAAAYATHPMAHSMNLAITAPDYESFPESGKFEAPASADYDVRLAYEVTTRDGQVLHHERAYDPSGDELCSRAVAVHFAVGSGQRGHSYFGNANGRLYMSPITWYAGSQSWDLSPGYERSNQHFERRVLDGCVACHVGRAAPKPDKPHMFEPEPFLEMSIGCERCHGPGEAHVAYHQGESSAGLDEDPIVNPAHLSQPYRDDVCFQCHLQGVTRVTHAGLRDFDFRPGQALADVWSVFIHGTKVSADNTTEAVGQAEQMLASRCYIESDGAMSCTSCHDPHSTPSEAARIKYYRSRCLDCHGEGDSVGCSLDRPERLASSPQDSCIACHMPKLDANDVPHTSQTDHRVIRKPREKSGTMSPPGFMVYEADRLSPEVIDRDKGLFFTHQAEETTDRVLASRAIPLLSPWVRKNPDDVEALSALGTCYALALDTARAIETLEQALKIDPKSEYTLRQLTNLSHDIGDLQNGIRYGRRLIALNPHHYDYHGRMAHMLGRMKQMGPAIESAQRAAEIQPWNFQIHGWLAEAYRLTAQPDLAEKHQELYEQLRPRHAR